MQRTEPDPIPQVRDKAPKPPGVLPKNVQACILIGVATVMVCVLAFSGGPAPPSGRTDPLSKSDGVTDPNAARIQEYRNRLETEARKLEAERQRLKQATAALMTEPEPEPDAGPPPLQPYGYYRLQPEPATPQTTVLEQERERREYTTTLFASNVALTYRDRGSPTEAAAPWPVAYPTTAAPQPANPPEYLMAETWQRNLKSPSLEKLCEAILEFAAATAQPSTAAAASGGDIVGPGSTLRRGMGGSNKAPLRIPGPNEFRWALEIPRHFKGQVRTLNAPPCD